ncbi:hypothetical protein RU639_003688 [Aspergillus parasiticus]
MGLPIVIQSHEFHKYTLSILERCLSIGQAESQAFVDGVWVRKEQTFSLYEPSTAQEFGAVAYCDLSDIRSAIESANAAQKSYYSSTTAAQRGSLSQKWHNLILENAANLARILCLENGKTIKESRAEITYAASFVS